MRKNSGYTLIEVSIVLTILTVVLTGAMTVMRQGEQNFEQTVSTTVANTKGNRAINTLARRLAGAGQGTITPSVVAPFSSEKIQFQVVSGWTGAPSWTEDLELRLQYDPAELNNGLDDDSDGFIDECEVILIENQGTADESQTVLVRRVQELLQGEAANGLDDNGNGLIDERGFCVEQIGDGSGLTLRLSVQRRRPGGGVDLQTVQTTVWLRN
jgi:prepilin-type N-terminal cleavage/methylation domain-containing protein